MSPIVPPPLPPKEPQGNYHAENNFDNEEKAPAPSYVSIAYIVAKYCTIGATAIITVLLFAVLMESEGLMKLLYSLPHNLTDILLVVAYLSAAVQFFGLYSYLSNFYVDSTAKLSVCLLGIVFAVSGLLQLAQIGEWDIFRLKEMIEIWKWTGLSLIIICLIAGITLHKEGITTISRRLFIVVIVAVVACLMVYMKYNDIMSGDFFYVFASTKMLFVFIIVGFISIQTALVMLYTAIDEYFEIDN